MKGLKRRRPDGLARYTGPAPIPALEPEPNIGVDASGILLVTIDDGLKTLPRLEYLRRSLRERNAREILKECEKKTADGIGRGDSVKDGLPESNLPAVQKLSTEKSVLSVETLKKEILTTTSSLDYASDQMVERMKSLPNSKDTELEVAKVACLCAKNLREIVKTKIDLTRLAMELMNGK